jgi:hypothetical protein
MVDILHGYSGGRFGASPIHSEIGDEQGRRIAVRTFFGQTGEQPQSPEMGLALRR